MEIFGIGSLELLLVFVLALIIIGPGKMPELAASLGKMLREFRAASAELTEALNAEIAEAERQKAAIAAGENGHSHSDAEAAEAEIVAQGEVDAAPVEFTSPEPASYQHESPAEAAPEPQPTTIEDVLAAIAQQEADEAARREAEEAARLAAIALERAIRDGVGPLPESLLLPSTDAPLAVVNPTESKPAEPAPVVETPVVEVAAADETAVLSATPIDESTAPAEAAEPDAPNGTPADAERDSLEARGAGQAEVH